MGTKVGHFLLFLFVSIVKTVCVSNCCAVDNSSKALSRGKTLLFVLGRIPYFAVHFDLAGFYEKNKFPHSFSTDKTRT